MGIAGILLPSVFPSDLGTGILSRDVRLSVLADLMMGGCAYDGLSDL